MNHYQEGDSAWGAGMEFPRLHAHGQGWVSVSAHGQGWGRAAVAQAVVASPLHEKVPPLHAEAAKASRHRG